MTAPSTVCPSCGEDVPFGRRTCEACGANVTTASEPHEEMSFDEEAVGGAAAPEAPAALDDAGWDAPTGPAELMTREAMIPEADVPEAMVPELRRVVSTLTSPVAGDTYSSVALASSTRNLWSGSWRPCSKVH